MVWKCRSLRMIDWHFPSSYFRLVQCSILSKQGKLIFYLDQIRNQSVDVWRDWVISGKLFQIQVLCMIYVAFSKKYYSFTFTCLWLLGVGHFQPELTHKMNSFKSGIRNRTEFWLMVEFWSGKSTSRYCEVSEILDMAWWLIPP